MHGRATDVASTVGRRSLVGRGQLRWLDDCAILHHVGDAAARGDHRPDWRHAFRPQSSRCAGHRACDRGRGRWEHHLRRSVRGRHARSPGDAGHDPARYRSGWVDRHTTTGRHRCRLRHRSRRGHEPDLHRKGDAVACAAHLSCFNQVGSASITFLADSMQVIVLLSLLGNDDGRMNFQASSYVLVAPLTPVVFDYLPNNNLAPARVQ